MLEGQELTAQPRVESDQHRSGLGVLLCLASAVAFGLAAVFAKQCFAAGFSVSSMLAGRFVIAAGVFWAVVAVRRPRLPSARVLLGCVALGGVGYALQAICYFTALTRIDASLAAQVLYLYPVFVLVLAAALRREKVTSRKLVALGCSVAGLAVLLHYAGSNGPVSPVGVLLAFGSALTYASYITVANLLPHDLDVYLLSALVCSSAAITIGGLGAANGSLQAPGNSAGWLWLGLLALISSVISIGCFLAGLRLVGATSASILSCLEPVVTVGSVMVVFGDRLNAGQLLGGVVVLVAVGVLLSARSEADVRHARTMPD